MFLFWVGAVDPMLFEKELPRICEFKLRADGEKFERR